MPLNDAEFEATRLDLANAALAFLRRNHEEAFSAEEVMVELGNVSVFSDLFAVTAALGHWVDRDRVTTRNVSGTLYYRYIWSLGFRPPRT